ncbi:MAG: serine/threonine transporter SstT [Mycoplasmatales bacterium]
MKNFIKKYNETNLIIRIIIGLIVGAILGSIVMNAGIDSSIAHVLSPIKLFGTLFVGALKAIAPILVFFLVVAAIAAHKEGKKTNMGEIVRLYLFATFIGAVVAVSASFISPVTLTLQVDQATQAAPTSVFEVLGNLITSIVANPVDALMNANYLSLIFWGILLGTALRQCKEATRQVFMDIADCMQYIVKFIIAFAPIGIMGLLFTTLSENDFSVLAQYSHILVVLLFCFGFMALIFNPLITWIYTRENPYPLVFKVLVESGMNAFFTRSSAANIPVNLDLCKRMDVDPDAYNVSIPLGATVNMSGAAITITLLTLAGANTLGIEVGFTQAIILSVVAALSACGAGGVAGGSLLLIPLACSLFNIDQDIAFQIVGVGFIIGVIQDSCETGLNSCSDALYTIIVDRKAKRLAAKK